VGWGDGFSCSGDPLLFEEYWMPHPELGTVVIPGWYRMSYQTWDAGTLADYCTDALKAAIQDLHALTGNAVTKGRYIVLGTGSTQLINTAVHSIALQQKEVSNVVASVPYYQVKFFSKLVSHSCALVGSEHL
jgi:hypothetical protein